MPDVIFRIEDASGKTAKATINISPTKRFVSGNNVVLPDPVDILLVSNPQTINMPPCGNDWCWKVYEKSSHLNVRYVIVPDVVGPIEYASLQEVDPTSFAPITPNTPAWLANYVTLARTPDVLASGAIIRNSDNTIVSFPVQWPDGATGYCISDILSTAFIGAVDAYHITHVLNGITTVYTQPVVTRDTNGYVTNLPPIVKT
jgi:hypothetical protein